MVHKPRSLQNLWSKALTKRSVHSEAANRRARSTAITVKQMVGKPERSWERQTVCAVVEQVVKVTKATNMDGTLHMHHCSNGDGDHDDEWHRHAHDHGRQLLGVLADGNVARCFKNRNGVTEHQPTTRTKTCRARENVNLAMQNPPRREEKTRRSKGQTATKEHTCTFSGSRAAKLTLRNIGGP